MPGERKVCTDCLVNQLNVFTNRGTRCSECSKRNHKRLIAEWKRKNRDWINLCRNVDYARRKNDRVKSAQS